MDKIWKIHKLNKEAVLDLSKKLSINPITASVLLNRGITDADKAFNFLDFSLSSLHDPFKMKDMDKAVSRILKAINNNEVIFVHGDYDVDGITSVALLVKCLKKLKAKVQWYIPNRLQEGYGLRKEGVKKALEKKAKLVITVDCGILAFEPVKELRQLNIDVIITDHHKPDDKLPAAYAVLNPLRKDGTYPFKYLAGVGVSFKLCHALLLKTGFPMEDIEDFLDMVALGTVSDVVPMTGENRILVKYGMKKINEFQNTGLKALAKSAGFKKTIDTVHISFIFGPRINASGRLGTADKALELLLSEDPVEAGEIAGFLDSNNKTRQEIQNNTFKEAVVQVEETVDFNLSSVIVIYNPSWHSGVIGIVASQLAEKYYRPVLVFCGESDMIQGSGRSIDGFHLYESVCACREYLESFGGHEMACGITMKKQKLYDFQNKLNQTAVLQINSDNLIPNIYIDTHIKLSHLNENVILELEKLSPFGPDNPPPVFCSTGLNIKHKPRFLRRKGFKMWVTDGKLTCQAIGFGSAKLEKVKHLSSPVHIAFSPYIESWQGEECIGLKVKDLKSG